MKGHLGRKTRPAPAAHEGRLPAQPQAADPFDAACAEQRPFGDSRYLHAQLELRYQERLGKIAELLPTAETLASALEQATPHRRHRALGDPVVRHAIHHALRHAWNGAQPTNDTLPLAACEEIFRETVAHLATETRGGGGPLESAGAGLRRLGPAPHHGAIWSEEHPDDVFGRAFRKIVHDNFKGEPLCVPSAAEVAMLKRGADLLEVLLPACAQSVLSHVHLVVLVPHVGGWKRKGSCSEFRISGTIFLNREMIRNPWWVAEHLLHEALHQKLYDFRHTHSLLAEDLSAEAPEPDKGVAIAAIWNLGGMNASTGWDTFRAIAAFHVYVHLALLCVQVDRRKTELHKHFGALPDAHSPATTGRREAFERAQYLGRRIKDACWQEMGPAGRLFVAWLRSILQAIDPAPPPPDTRYLNLLLQRYMLEAHAIAARDALPPELEHRLRARIDAEAEILRQVLRAVQATASAVGRLDDALTGRSEEAPGAAFLRFRNGVSEILRELSPDGYGVQRGSSADSSASLDDMLRAMMDGSSVELTPLLSGPAG
jgi:hypothetical protein